MGSYCTIYFDQLEVCSAKSAVPDVFGAIFQESDRLTRESRHGKDDTSEVVYEATSDVILSRLDLLGCTSQASRERLSKWISDEQEYWTDYALYDDQDWVEEIAEAIRKLTLEEWYRRVPQVLHSKHKRDQPIDVIEQKMREFDSSWLWFDGRDSLVGFRALLDANPDVEKVTLDISDLIQGGWLDEYEPVSRGARRDENQGIEPLAPTVVLAEGRSDITILERSLPILFPERQDYFSFFEHKELNVDGGASYLVKFLKAFAAARTPLRLIAIFDNDTAGRQAHQQAEILNLPDNIILFRLPDTQLARRYPTIGPQGIHVVDVNGKAASIELYLGRSALTINDQLCRVRWAGYNKSTDSYQGEVDGKDEVKKRFFQKLESASHPSGAQEAFPELAEVWRGIFAAVGRCCEATHRNTVHFRWHDAWYEL